MTDLNTAIALFREPKPEWLPTLDQCLFEKVFSPKGNWYCFADYSEGDKVYWLPVAFKTDARLYMALFEEMANDENTLHIQLSFYDYRYELLLRRKSPKLSHLIINIDKGRAICLTYCKLKGIEVVG